MLSALIVSEHSYPAMPLAGQPADQRFVHPGPLVAYSIITNGADYIFALSEKPEIGHRHIIIANFTIIHPAENGTSRYGVKSKILINSSRVFFFLEA